MRNAITLALVSATFWASASQAGAQSLDTVQVAQFSSPTYAISPPGDMDRLFVTEQNGLIRILQDPRSSNPTILPTPFLDVTGISSCCGERGLFSLAFHPDYDANGRFFISYTNNAGNSRVVEYAVSATDPNVADPTPVQTILATGQPFANHNGGCIQFGPDGKLYVGLGDGGSANDPGNRSQDPTTLLGKMLRFDVDIAMPFIPADNPFVGSTTFREEIWALGIRNPWRFSFDALTGDMYMGDVGQGAREEVNIQLATSAGGENYGWRCMEGFNCTGLSGCTCNAIALTLPAIDYNHGGGRCSITGGYVYRGSMIPGLEGTYFYGDFCSAQIFTLQFDGTSVTQTMDRTADLQPSAGGSINLIASFAEDGAGEMYIISQSGGRIFRIVGDCPATVSNFCVAAPNSAGAGAAIDWSGDLGVGDNNFILEVGGAPANQFGLFFYSTGQVQLPFGDGFLCLDPGTGLFRLMPAGQTDSAGNAMRQVDFTTSPADMGAGMINAGTSYSFQFWYRDPAAGGAGFNTSDGLQVTFCN